MGEQTERVVDRDGRYYYQIELPKLSPNEMKLINKVREEASKKTEGNLAGLTDEQRKQNVMFQVMGLLDRLKGEVQLAEDKKHHLAQLIVNDVTGLSLLEPLLEDDHIEEIMVIGPKRPVYIFHRRYGMLESNVFFEDPIDSVRIVQRIASSVGRRFDEDTPLLDARLMDGSRVNATLSPPSVDGSTVTIRKFKKDPLTIVDLINFKTFTTEVAAFLWVMIDGYGAWQKNLIIAGGTGSGKTSTMNSLTIFIREKERVITIEDTAELQIPIKHLVRFESRAPDVEGKGEIDMDALVKNTLRMRPDRIIIGEVRGREAKSLFIAMNTGHNGNFASLHANNSRECITRLTNEPMNVPLIMIPALDLILMQSRMSRGDKGSIRRITEITEIGGVTEDTVALNKIYEWDPGKDELKSTGTPSKLKQDLAKQLGITVKDITEEIEKRKLVLDYLVKENIRELSKVRNWVEDYYNNSENTLKKIEEALMASQPAEQSLES